MAKVLIGFMGAGKSTVARLLDEQFIDMDAVIEKRIGMPIASYFLTYGEEAFRQLEHDILLELLQQEHVLSTGGGIVVHPANRALLKEADEVIYLSASFETLYDRIKSDRFHRRPLFEQNSREDLQKIFHQRQAWYRECANQIVVVENKTPNEIVEEL